MYKEDNLLYLELLLFNEKSDLTNTSMSSTYVPSLLPALLKSGGLNQSKLSIIYNPQ